MASTNELLERIAVAAETLAGVSTGIPVAPPIGVAPTIPATPPVGQVPSPPVDRPLPGGPGHDQRPTRPPAYPDVVPPIGGPGDLVRPPIGGPDDLVRPPIGTTPVVPPIAGPGDQIKPPIGTTPPVEVAPPIAGPGEWDPVVVPTPPGQAPEISVPKPPLGTIPGGHGPGHEPKPVPTQRG